MKRNILLALNSLTLPGVIIFNYLAGTGSFGGKTVGEISAQYETLFTPAGYAFAIWGIIYLMLIAFVAWQWRSKVTNQDTQYIDKTGIWLILGNIFNVLWILAWTNDHIGLSLVLIFLMLLSLLVLMFRLRLETWDAPVRTIVFVWWPITIYLGWLVAASVANTAVYLVSIDWQMFGIPENAWSISMIIVATLIYVLLIFSRNMREAAAVGIWALVAIAVNSWTLQRENAIVALVCSGILLILISLHGYANRSTSIPKKIQRKEL